MRLGTLSLACQDKFMESSLIEGPMTLRVKYRHVDSDAALTLAKALTLVVGFNAKQPITFDELRNPANRMASLFFDNDATALAAIAAAFQNQGTVLRGAVQHLSVPTKCGIELTCLRNKKAYTPIVFEYVWRVIARYNGQDAKPAVVTSIGPVENFVRNQLMSNSDKLKAFLALGDAAGMSPYINMDDALKSSNECWLFGPIWRKCNTMT